MARGICCLLLAFAVYAPLVRKIYRWNQVSPAQIAEAQRGLVDPGSVNPEPAERSSYIVGCLLACPLLFGLFWVLHGLENWSGNASRWQCATLSAGAILVAFQFAKHAFHGWQLSAQQAALFAGLAVAPALCNGALRSESSPWRLGLEVGGVLLWTGCLLWSLWSNDFVPVLLNVVYRQPLWSLPVLLAAWPAMAWVDRDSRSARWLGRLVIGLALAVGYSTTWMGEHSRYTLENNHFAAAFDPVAQVHLGKDLLVDYDSQYGLYPDLVAPLFALVGLSVLKYTLLFGGLTVASFALLAWSLSQAVARRSVALVGSLALVFNGWLLFQLCCHAAHPNHFDPYFQYLPIRLLFPASAVALTWLYHCDRSRRLCWFAHFWLAVGVLWNLDSGLVALAAWLGALIFDALFEPDWAARGRLAARHALAAATAAASVVAAYALVKYACYGAWPAGWHLLDFQRLFYLTGFYMLPMRFAGVWPLVVLAYLAGILQAAAALRAGRRGPRTALTFLLSILGLGLFSYYQGRSHDLCLILCWWPALFLLPIYWDELSTWVRERRQPAVLAWGLRVSIAVFLLSSAVSLVTELPGTGRLAAEQLVETFQPGSPFTDDVGLLRHWVPRSDNLLVLSRSAAVLHLDSGIPSLAPGALVQMLWIAKYEVAVRTLEESRRSWVFIGRDYDRQFFISPKQNFGSMWMMAEITQRLRKVAESPHGCLYEFCHERLSSAKSNVLESPRLVH